MMMISLPRRLSTAVIISLLVILIVLMVSFYRKEEKISWFGDSYSVIKGRMGLATISAGEKKAIKKNVNFSKLIDLDVPLHTSGFYLEDLFITSALATDVSCSNSERIGNIDDGGWNLCTDNDYAPRKPCLVYSFGINNEWSFDDSISKKYECLVRAFDPSMADANHKRGSNILFYKEGLAGKDVITKDKMWRLNTLSSFLRIFNEENVTIDYLKIDITYYEWETLETALQDGSLKNVKQLGVEIHTDEVFRRTTTVENYQKFFKVFQNLRSAGFYKWYTHSNPNSAIALSNHSDKVIKCCYEFVYLNLNM